MGRETGQQQRSGGQRRRRRRIEGWVLGFGSALRRNAQNKHARAYARAQTPCSHAHTYTRTRTRTNTLSHTLSHLLTRAHARTHAHTHTHTNTLTLTLTLTRTSLTHTPEAAAPLRDSRHANAPMHVEFVNNAQENADLFWDDGAYGVGYTRSTPKHNVAIGPDSE